MTPEERLKFVHESLGPSGHPVHDAARKQIADAWGAEVDGFVLEIMKLRANQKPPMAMHPAFGGSPLVTGPPGALKVVPPLESDEVAPEDDGR